MALPLRLRVVSPSLDLRLSLSLSLSLSEPCEFLRYLRFRVALPPDSHNFLDSLRVAPIIPNSAPIPQIFPPSETNKDFIILVAKRNPVGF